MADPTIKIASCRSDGRCPECCLSLQERGGRLSLLPLPSCGCHCCPEHERGHLNALVTEALTEINRLRHWREDESASFGMSREVCAALREERDAALRDVEMWKGKAIRVSGEADALERERDEAQAKLVEEREAMASISGELVQAQVKVAKERDSYRAALEECGELRSEARERAERADIERRQLRALLRECQDAVRIAASAEEDHGAIDRARELDALSAKIKEVLG